MSNEPIKLSAERMTDPYLLAERIDYGIIGAAVLLAGSGRDEYTLRPVWERMEPYLSDGRAQEPLDTRVEESYFEALRIAEHGGTLNARMQAQMFLAGIDLMASRGHGRSIEKEDITRSYRMMANVLADNIEHFDDKNLHDTLAEMVTYALIARRGDTMNVPFVTSPRERRSSQLRKNHNLYTTDDALTIKTAMRVHAKYKETPREAAPESFVYRHSSEGFLTRNSYSHDLEAVCKLREVAPAKTYNQIVAELIAGEPDEGYRPGSPEACSLAALSKSLIEQLNRHRLQVLGLSAKTGAIREIKEIAAKAQSPKLGNPKPAQPNVCSSPPAPELPLLPRRRVLQPGDFIVQCGEKRLINPYVQAEHIHPEIITGQPSRGRRSYTSLLWQRIELGLATQDSKEVVSACEEASNIAGDRKQTAEERVKADMIASGQELLVKRAVDPSEISRDDVLRSFGAMAEVLLRIEQKAYRRLAADRYHGCRAEILNYCLVAYAANTEFVPYLGSSREEASPLVSANHDMYTLSAKANSSKIAAQVKKGFRSEYAERYGTPEAPKRTFIFPIYTRETLDEQATAMDVKFRSGINEAARLIIRATYDSLTDQDADHLRGFSDKILGLFVSHRKHLRHNKKLHKMPYTTAPSSKDYIAGL